MLSQARIASAERTGNRKRHHPCRLPAGRARTFCPVRVDGSHLQEGDTTARPAIRLLILLSAAVMGPSRIGRFRRGTASIDLGVSEHEARYLRFCGRAAA